MQAQMFAVPIPPLLAIGFLIGIILLILGYRNKNSQYLGLGMIVIGIMIPVTPISWYLYWIVTNGLVLDLLEIAIIVVALIIGVLILYQGIRTYSSM